MEIESALQGLLANIRNSANKPKPQPATSTLVLPTQPLSSRELADCLATLGKIYGHSLMNVLEILDRVSGSLSDLQAVLQGNHTPEWTPEEDQELGKSNSSVEKLLVMWKGADSVERRKRYLGINK